jgi:hypothetical protein
MSRIHKLREQIFSFFYVLTERSDQSGNESIFTTMCWSLLYLVDAGQVVSAMTLQEYGWHPDVLVYLDKLDTFKTIFTSVKMFCPSFSYQYLGYHVTVSLRSYRMQLKWAEYYS